MSRLDNTSESTISYYALQHLINADDPAALNPIDLCLKCFSDWAEEGEELEVDHPDYRDSHYTCFECGVKLTEEDN